MQGHWPKFISIHTSFFTFHFHYFSHIPHCNSHLLASTQIIDVIIMFIISIGKTSALVVRGTVKQKRPHRPLTEHRTQETQTVSVHRIGVTGIARIDPAALRTLRDSLCASLRRAAAQRSQLLLLFECCFYEGSAPVERGARRDPQSTSLTVFL